MRVQLINIVKQSAVRAEKFGDYNFRKYFVAKFVQKAEMLETQTNLTVTQEDINRAQR